MSDDAGTCTKVSLVDISAARDRIQEYVHSTPVMQSSYLDSISGLQLLFKCENFQKTGSFKIRGATNAVKRLCESCSKEAGDKPVVVTHSSGNHAQALALAARLCGVTAHIVMPKNCSAVKVQAVKDYGGLVTMCENTEQARKDTTQQLLSSLGPHAAFISSAEHDDIIAGQGTVAMEFLDQVPDLDVIVCSVGVGGLAAGVSIAAKALKPNICLVGSEPKNAEDCARSMAAGRLIPNASPPVTIADSLRMSVSKTTWPVLKSHLKGVVTVSEEEMVRAMRLVWERMKLVIEPGAACSVAAVLSDQFKALVGPEVKKVGVVLCGGNVDLDHLPWVKAT